MGKPVCIAFVHRTKDLSICGKSAKWLVNGKGICWDCVSKYLINLGDGVDTMTFKIIKDGNK